MVPTPPTVSPERAARPAALGIPVIGVVGGIASGKSAVAQQLAALGGTVIDGDRLGHEVLTLPQVREAIRHVWGDAVFAGNGQVDRRALARRVFGPSTEPAGERRSEGPSALAQLEAITHPEIEKLLEQRIRAVREAQAVPAIVVDAAVLLKAGWDRHCDQILFVDAPRPTRLLRALERGWTETEFEAREQAQWPVEMKRQRATHVVNGDRPLAEVAEYLRQWWRQQGLPLPQPGGARESGDDISSAYPA